MYVILVYDVDVKRVAKVLKIARRYLTWVQNSVLEGELTPSQYFQLKNELRRVANLNEDSFIFYVMRTSRYSEREIMGVQKGGWETIL
ncbi:CRISPR-associated endonuclease Cas2 [Calditerricola satsumensis]|uniref:CRISPR-associated endonuclease Cas2 n=1 Tax=Calditerricola satsumensis TaxID=373054 RepID=UPI0006CF4F5C|nr:CRISPR-associated endonuclease Cas2 [Calditerricola satsumensis]